MSMLYKNIARICCIPVILNIETIVVDVTIKNKREIKKIFIRLSNLFSIKIMHIV